MTAGVPSDGGPAGIDGGEEAGLPAAELTAHQCPECGGVGIGAGEMRCCGVAMEDIEAAEPVETPSLADVLQNVFGMCETELRICIELMRDGAKTAAEVAECMSIDDTYANRLLNHLVDLEVVEEQSYLLEGGGRVSRYTHASIPDVEASFKQELAVWAVRAMRIIDEDVVAEKRAALDSAADLADELGEDSIYYEC